MQRERILITGPGGRVGTEIVPLLREHFILRLFDAQQLRGEGDDEVCVGDIRDLGAVRRACAGASAMIHLAAISDEADFHSRLLPVNLEGIYNAFEAARQAGLRKVLFASTGQTVQHYPKGQPITTDMPPRPWTVYACTKVFGEALARWYSDQYGMSMIVIRICYFQAPTSELLRIPGHEIQQKWVSPRDLAQLIVKCLRSDLKFANFFGVSNNTGRFWDISNAQQLVGYAPQDNAAEFLSTGPLTKS